jgi:hypothetical protein
MLAVYDVKLLLYSEVWASAMNPLGKIGPSFGIISDTSSG